MTHLPLTNFIQYMILFEKFYARGVQVPFFNLHDVQGRAFDFLFVTNFISPLVGKMNKSAIYSFYRKLFVMIRDFSAKRETGAAPG